VQDLAPSTIRLRGYSAESLRGWSWLPRPVVVVASTLSFSLIIARSRRASHLPCLEHLVAQQQVRRNSGSRCYAVAEHTERVVNTLLCRVHGFSSCEVQADDVAFGVFVLQRSH
jgi:hypothetical protein